MNEINEHLTQTHQNRAAAVAAAFRRPLKLTAEYRAATSPNPPVGFALLEVDGRVRSAGRFRESAARQVVVAHRPARRRRLRGLIWGDTAHFEYISQAASGGLMAASLETGIPLAFGVLTAYTEALARGRSDAHTKGREAAEACLASMHGLRLIDAARGLVPTQQRSARAICSQYAAYQPFR